MATICSAHAGYQLKADVIVKFIDEKASGLHLSKNRFIPMDAIGDEWRAYPYSMG